MSATKILLDRPCRTEGPSFEDRSDGRFCHHCRETQYDLRDATRSEVVALIRKKGGRVCGQLRLGPSGEPKFKPETPPRAQQLLRGAAVALALAACDSPSEATVTPEPVALTPPPTEAPPPQTTLTGAPPPPATPVGIDPPQATEIATADDTIDHSTDQSANLADHRRHRHTHARVAPPGDPGTLAVPDDIGYAGGLAISQP
jgi:hypothetical protein